MNYFKKAALPCIVTLLFFNCCVSAMINTDSWEKKTWKGHGNEIYDMIFIDNNTCASSSTDGTVKIWDVKTGECLHIIKNVFWGERDPLPRLALVKKNVIALRTKNEVVVVDLKKSVIDLNDFKNKKFEDKNNEPLRLINIDEKFGKDSFQLYLFRSSMGVICFYPQDYSVIGYDVMKNTEKTYTEYDNSHLKNGIISYVDDNHLILQTGVQENESIKFFTSIYDLNKHKNLCAIDFQSELQLPKGKYYIVISVIKINSKLFAFALMDIENRNNLKDESSKLLVLWDTEKNECLKKMQVKNGDFSVATHFCENFLVSSSIDKVKSDSFLISFNDIKSGACFHKIPINIINEMEKNSSVFSFIYEKAIHILGYADPFAEESKIKICKMIFSPNKEYFIIGFSNGYMTRIRIPKTFLVKPEISQDFLKTLKKLKHDIIINFKK